MRKPLFRVVGIGVKLVASALLIALLAGCSLTALPSDASLMRKFNSNRESLDELVSMLRSDRTLQLVDSKATKPSPLQIDPERISKYRELLSTAGCDRGLEREGHGVFFRVAGAAYGRKGETKGFYFSPSRPSPVVPKLDGIRLNEENPQAFRQIESEWYLFSFTNSP